MMNTNILLALVTTVFLTAGQILWKAGLTGISFTTDYPKLFISLIKSSPIIIGIFLYVISTLLWFIVLKSAPFSKVYPILATSYILGMIAAAIVFNEKVSIINWMGGTLIIAGVVLATWQN